MTLNNADFLKIEFQSRVFELSLSRCPASSYIFIRRFMNANITKQLDNVDADLLLLDEEEYFDMMNKEYPESSYGKEKLTPEILSWIGHIYRYICITRGLSSKSVYRLIKPKFLAEVYYVYHTQDEEWCFARICDALKYQEEDFSYQKTYYNNLKKSIQSLLSNSNKKCHA